MQDAIGIAIARTHVNNRVAAAESEAASLDGADIPVQGAEYATELHDGVPIISGFVLRPNLQFIHDSGGTSANHDALILGLKAVATF